MHVNGEPTIDGSVLAALSRLGQGTAARLVTLFVRAAPEMLQELREALVARDADRLAHASHKLRGMSANVGARQLSVHCKGLSGAARAGTVPDDAVHQVAAIAREYEQAAAALRAWSNQERPR